MRFVLIATMVVLSALASLAQGAGHSVVLTWSASTDPGAAYNVYRAAGTIGGGNSVTCPAAPVIPLPVGSAWTQITTGVTATTYTDTAVSAGSAYCYAATSTLSGLESGPSNVASALVFPAPPSGLTAAAH